MDKLTLGLLAAVAAVAGAAFYGARKDAAGAQPATTVDPGMAVRSPFKGDDGMVIRSPFKGDDGMVVRSPFKGDDGIVIPTQSNGTGNG
jgi:hypothetical protein